MKSDRMALIEELVAGREAVLQACWAQQSWGVAPLRLSDGQPLQVVFPGWINRGSGPDFQDARLLVGTTELVGDVEIHVDERDWHRHAHDQDPRYSRVILHVVLARGDAPAVQSVSGARIALFDIARHLTPDTLRVLGDPDQLLRNYETLPGRCGLRASQSPPEALEAVVAHAAESRARQKADRLNALWPQQDEEQLLFELIFQSLGYRPYAQLFRTLAQQFPLRTLHRYFAHPPQQAREEVLARWFGAIGIFDGTEPAHLDAPAAAERQSLQRIWEASGEAPLSTPLQRGGARPWNSPERRMVGLYHHLGMLHGDLMKGWLKFLKELDTLRDQPTFRSYAQESLRTAFATPANEPWAQRVSYGVALTKEAQLVGEDRMAVVLVNAIVPFFLTYSRRNGEAELEKVLYRLFLVLPGEGPNARTRFMTQRLMPLRPLGRTLRTQQGLIQIHQDFCTSFESGCADCRFPDLIDNASSAPSGH